MKTKKIVLFIVEGITDEMSLSLILSKLVQDSSVQFHVINQDITADFNSNCQNIIRKIDSQVKKFLAQNNGLKKTDIKEIIHLVDTDGAFIKEDFVKEDMNQEKTFYTHIYPQNHKNMHVFSHKLYLGNCEAHVLGYMRKNKLCSQFAQYG